MNIKAMTCLAVISLALTGCTQLTCWPACNEQHTHGTSSLVEFLYPNGSLPPQRDAIPQLRIPLRVGLAFLPAHASNDTGTLDAAHREELLERIRERFSSRKFVADIVIIPDYYLAGRPGLSGLAGVQRLYGVDLMALVSYDQVISTAENPWSLGYLTIVGAYVLKGDRHDVSTLIDLAVVDPQTRTLVLRAGGTDTRHGNTTGIDSQRKMRDSALEGYDAAAGEMMQHFDDALTRFEADVKSGKAAVQVVNKNGSPHAGGGAIDSPMLLALLVSVGFQRYWRQSRPQAWRRCAVTADRRQACYPWLKAN